MCRGEAGNGAGKRCKWLIHKPLKPRTLVCKPLVICSKQIAVLLLQLMRLPAVAGRQASRHTL